MWQAPFNPLRAPWNNTNDINDHIDWAVLAKNWIQQKEMFGDLEEPPVNVNPIFQPESTSIESLDPSLTTVNISDMTNAETTDYTNFDNLYENYETNGEEWQEWGFDSSYQDAAWMDPDFDQQSSNSNIMNVNNLNLPAWAVPPPPPPDSHSHDNKVPMLSEIQLNMFNLANQNLIQNTAPFNQQRPPNFMHHRPLGPGFPNMWVPIGQRMPSSNVPKLMGEMRPRMRHRPPHNWAPPAYNHITIDDSFLDANRRRQLPAWIREGLEKMEREKQKQLDKERRKQLELESKQKKLLQQQLIDPSISKFDESENEDEIEEGEDVGERDEGGVVADVLAEAGGEEEGPEVEEQISEEEKQMRMILKVKQWMTEILLDVTNNEMVAIVESAFRRAKSKQAKAPARQLVSSSALASLCNLGDDSENEETERVAKSGDGEMEGSDASESEDEAIFSERLRCKRQQFERRMKLLEQQNYQSDVLPELVDNSRVTIPETPCNQETKEDSSSGEISEDSDRHKSNRNSKHDNAKNKSKKSPSTEKESMEQKKMNSDKIKRRFEEQVYQNYHDFKGSNGNKDSRHRESTDSKDNCEALKRDEHIKPPNDSPRRNRSSRERQSSKKHRKRSKSSERKSSKKDKKDSRSDERSRNSTHERRRHDSSSDHSRDNKSHRDRKNKRHRSRSRS